MKTLIGLRARRVSDGAWLWFHWDDDYMPNVSPKLFYDDKMLPCRMLLVECWKKEEQRIDTVKLGCAWFGDYTTYLAHIDLKTLEVFTCQEVITYDPDPTI